MRAIGTSCKVSGKFGSLYLTCCNMWQHVAWDVLSQWQTVRLWSTWTSTLWITHLVLESSDSGEKQAPRLWSPVDSCTALICFVYLLRADCPTYSTRTMGERLVLWILQRAFAGADLDIVGGFERSTFGMMMRRFFQAAWGSKKKFLGFSFLCRLFEFLRKVL